LDLTGSEVALQSQPLGNHVLSPTHSTAEAPELIRSPSGNALASGPKPQEELCQAAYQSLASSLQVRRKVRASLTPRGL
jgi:hypothetical protein